MNRFVAIAAILAAGPALAHTGHGPVSGFAAGLGHPVGGLDHLLAMVAVGAWSALALPMRQAWVAPLAFVLAMLAGAGLAFAGVGLPMVEAMILASVVAMGVLVALRLPLPAAVGAALVAAFALFHGHAHGSEAAGAASAYMAGFALSTAALHIAGVGAGLLLRHSRLASGLAGSAVAAAGIALIAG